MPWRRVSRWKKEDLCDATLTGRITNDDAGSPFPLRDFRFVERRAFQECVRTRFMADIGDAAVHDLKRRRPRQSAARVFSVWQTVMVTALLLAATAGAFMHPLTTLIAANSIITAYFVLAIFYRVLLLSIGGAPPPADIDTERILSDDDLPIITILAPLYRDAASLAPLSEAIDALDYPADKKDVKLLLEEDDTDTIASAKALGLDTRYDLIVTPDFGPRTKPKACNYGMHLARGDLIVIYDAEDQPEPDQLRKAVHAFHGRGRELACVQARLNYYNRRENWLTRLFALEYALWFDWLLPGLQRIGAPVPLGGTSNFLRTDVLLEVGGWDPYNVTEDADLGLRLSQEGYKVEVFDSTTFEEANCRLGNWVRQRSRWMKGYLQTWIVHMRRPGDIVATSGWSGFLGVQLFIAGNVLSALVNPILWAVFIAWALLRLDVISAAFPGPLLWFNLFALTVGNFFFMTLAVIAPLKRGWLSLCVFGLTAPLYWMLTSLAAYKAVWQMFVRPHYWEKTDHAISDIAKKRCADAHRRQTAKRETS